MLRHIRPERGRALLFVPARAVALPPGHTRGCTSWSFPVTDGDTTRLAVSICSLSVLDGMRFVGEETYPGIAADFERSFERLRELPAELFLASHAEFFRLEEKRAALGAGGGGESPFVDPEGYRRYIDRAEERFREVLRRQREEEAQSAGGGSPDR